MDVVLKMAAEAIDALTQHGHLYFCGTGVGAVSLVGVDQLLLLGGVKRHARGAALSIQRSILPIDCPLFDGESPIKRIPYSAIEDNTAASRLDRRWMAAHHWLHRRWLVWLDEFRVRRSPG